MELALLAGVILGLRLRVGLALAATAGVLAMSLGAHAAADDARLFAIVCAAVLAAMTQAVAMLVHAVKVGVTDAIAPRG